MEYVNIYKTQIDKAKHNDKDSLSVHRKSSKKFKSKKKRKFNKKEDKKHKRKRKYSSSSSKSYDSDKFEWVEREDNKVLSCTAENLIESKVQANQLKRDEWMNLESFVPYMSKSNAKSQESDMKREDETKILNKPGQSDRELNPYWKDGGDGLPQNNPRKLDNPKILDANWLKKSLRRAKEQASRDGKSLEEVAAERWGSLEAIQVMIAKAESMSNAEQNKKSYYKRYCNERNDKDLHGNFDLGREHSRSSGERARKVDQLSQRCVELKQNYRKPENNDDYHQQTVPTSSRIKSWKKDKNGDKRCKDVIELPTFDHPSREVDSVFDNTSTTNSNKDIDVLTETQMNKLGARVIKAELMGDDELATKLKIQLEHARKHVASYNTIAQEETVILTRTDAKGTARPIQSRNQSKRFAENDRKKKTAETHISGERVRYFVDDDKYSLREMFQQEKGRSANEDEEMLMKIVSRSTDQMDDVFEQQITRTDSETRQDKRNYIQAIKEHKDLSKRMDNCWWCLDSKNMLKHMVVTMDSVICLNLPACTSLTNGHCILTPIQHIACQLQLDEDAWDRLKELKKKLIKMFTNEDLYPIFYEVYKKHCKFSHMQLECIPLPKEIGESAPIYFKKALLECETEWSINKKIVDLTCKDIRHAIPNGLSYFMVEFGSHPGYAHIIENEEMFPRNFAKEIIGGMLDLDHNLWRKPRRQNFEEQRLKVLEFTEKWKKV
ncbi:hypothetical protein P5V15_002172 [Pogonomyrmex californicus]